MAGQPAGMSIDGVQAHPLKRPHGHGSRERIAGADGIDHFTERGRLRRALTGGGQQSPFLTASQGNYFQVKSLQQRTRIVCSLPAIPSNLAKTGNSSSFSLSTLALRRAASMTSAL